MGYNQRNDIRLKEKRTDTFHPDIYPIQADDMAFGCRCGINGISQILQNLARSEIKMIQISQNNIGQILKVAIYIH